jgi:energy-converting hydrogenase Eha subunit E
MPDDHSEESGELREALLVFVPALIVAFSVNWALVSYAGWAARRALITSIVVGIVLALLLQRAVRRVE